MLTKTKCVGMDDEAQHVYLSAYYGPDYESIPGFAEAWSKKLAKAKHDKRSTSDDTTPAALESDFEDESTGHLEKRWTCHVKINCRAVCQQDTPVYNKEACSNVCKNGKNNDCVSTSLIFFDLQPLLTCVPNSART